MDLEQEILDLQALAEQIYNCPMIVNLKRFSSRQVINKELSGLWNIHLNGSGSVLITPTYSGPLEWCITQTRIYLLDEWNQRNQERFPESSSSISKETKRKCPECGSVLLPSEEQDGWHRACLDAAASYDLT